MLFLIISRCRKNMGEWHECQDCFRDFFATSLDAWNNI